MLAFARTVGSIVAVLVGLTAGFAYGAEPAPMAVGEKDPVALFERGDHKATASETSDSKIRYLGIPGSTQLLAIYEPGQATPHTIRLDTSLVNLRDKNALVDSLKTLSEAIAPGDTEVRLWMLEGYGRSWQRRAVLAENPDLPPESAIVEWSYRGVSYSAFGVPPDVASMIITVRDACRPRLNPKQLYRDWHRLCR